MNADVVLEAGLVVDGTNAAPFVSDVAISEGRIVALGGCAGVTADVRIDCAGLVVAPGFIDIHTHYDAQVLWDPALTPSSWYGVTTVVMGGCGLSLAPTRPDGRVVTLETLESVEAMPRAALDAGVAWDFASFPEYLDVVRERRPRLNVAAMIGHEMLRIDVLGEDAFTRPSASADELRAMQGQVEAAIEAGAFGFSCSKQPSHVDGKGRPVPGRVADVDEFFALADVLGTAGRGLIQANRGPGFGLPEIASMAQRSNGLVTWTSMRSTPNTAEARALLERTSELQGEGARIWPQMTCVPIVTSLSLERPYSIESLPSFAGLAGSTRDARLAAYADMEFRRAVDEDFARDFVGRRIVLSWDRLFVSESASAPELEGRTLEDLASDAHRLPVDVMFDLAVADGLATRLGFIATDYDEDVLCEFLRSPVALLGLSDAGAHTSELCGASYPAELLGHWVREKKAFALEFAVWRMTGHIADALGFADRGKVQVGRMADLCVFDPATVRQGPPRRVVDQPAGAERMVRDVDGIHHVFVNGVQIMENGEPLEARPGRLLAPPS